MRFSRRLSTYAAIAIVTTGCGPSIEVRTIAAPDARFSALHNFHLLFGPTRRDGRAPSGADDPMINNSIANRVIREQIIKAFHGRGYAFDETRPDFAVAFYATAHEKLDLTAWDYGYPFRPGWPRYGGPAQTVTEYTEGTVVIDVIDPGSKDLLWRGVGKARLSYDPIDYTKELAKAAEAIVAKFPKAQPATIAALTGNK